MTTILVSLHGRDVGLDVDRNLTARVGAKFPSLYVGTSGSELQIDGVTTASTAANISASGLTNITSTGAVAFTLDAPQTGHRKAIHATANSTAARTITLVSGTFSSTSGSSQNRATINLLGQSLTLQALSTSLYAVLANIGSVAFTTA
jgi:hypothetical protein